MTAPDDQDRPSEDMIRRAIAIPLTRPRPGTEGTGEMSDARTIRLVEAVTALLALLHAEGVYVESEAHGHRLDAAEDRVLAVLAEIEAEAGAEMLSGMGE